MNTDQLIDEVKSLPVEERARIADSLLRSLNQTDSEIDREWSREAKRRLKEIRQGGVDLTPGEDVFEEIREKYDK